MSKPVIVATLTGSAIKTPFSRQERPAPCSATFTRPSATDAANPAKPRFNRAPVAFPLNSLARLGGVRQERKLQTKDEAKLKLRDLILVFGRMPRGNIRPTDLAPGIVPEHESLACRAMRWGWRVPWDKKPLINAML